MCQIARFAGDVSIRAAAADKFSRRTWRSDPPSTASSTRPSPSSSQLAPVADAMTPVWQGQNENR
jgi:hypothetical protein